MTFYTNRHKVEVPTLGVEMEYQIIDPVTRALSSETEKLIEEGVAIYGAHIRPEFHMSMVETVTSVCANVQEVTEQVAELRRTVMGLARKRGLRVVAASTHPITHWDKVALTPGERYAQIQKDLGDLARANLIYGMHCHVGIKDPDARIAVMNGARYFLPHLLALSCSSPYWQARDTGLASVRTGIFRRFPRTGIPEFFNNWAEYENHVRTLVETGCIDNAKKIWWDLRPHPFFPTVEFRVCDVPTRLREVAAITAFIHILGLRLTNLYHRNLGVRLFRRAYINENIFRAMRFGVQGDFINLATKKVVPVKDSIRSLLDDWDDEIEFLELQTEVGYIHEILERGSSAYRQRKVMSETGSLDAVVDHLVEETEEYV